MKKQLLVVLLALVMVFSMVSLIACQPEQPATYTLTYAAGAGSGTAPESSSHEEGAEVTLAANTFTAPEGKEFDGWLVDGVKKAAGDKITMPASNLTATAQWKTKEDVDPEPSTEKSVTLYFYNVDGWTEVYAYAWTGAGATAEEWLLGAWSGAKMTAVAGHDNWVQIELKADLDEIEVQVIFNNGSDQTDDLEVDATKLYYSKNGAYASFAAAEDATEPEPEKPEVTLYYYNSEAWDEVHAYAWIGNKRPLGNWPGNEMTEVAGHDDWYQIAIEADLDNDGVTIIFNGGNDQPQTANLPIEDSTNVYFTYVANGSTVVENYAFASFEEAEAAVNPPQPVTPVITSAANVSIQHEGEDTIGWLLLEADGEGYLFVADKANEQNILLGATITYTINSEGELKITSASAHGSESSPIVVPATGSIVGRTVSITIKAAEGEAQYKFESVVYKLRVEYGFEIEDGVSVTENYVPEGVPSDLTDIQREGYSIKSIKVDGEEITEEQAKNATMLAKDIVISYEWEQDEQPATWTVTFDPNNDGETWTVEVAEGATVAKPATDPTRDNGKTFRYWTIDGAAYNFATPVTGDLELTAEYAWKITFLAGEGATGTIEDQWLTAWRPQGITLPEATGLSNGDKVFAGWSDGTDVYQAGATYGDYSNYSTLKNVTFTAQWQEPTVNDGYTVSYEIGWRAEGTAPASATKQQGDTVTLPDQTGFNVTSSNLDYEFTGWKNSVDNQVYQPGDTYQMPAQNVTFTAQWAKIQVTVSFDANGGSGEMAPVTKQINANYVLPACAFTAPDGKEFAGWALSENGSIAQSPLQLSPSILSNNAVTLYAIWQNLPATTPEAFVGKYDVVEIDADENEEEYVLEIALNGETLTVTFGDDEATDVALAWVNGKQQLTFSITSGLGAMSYTTTYLMTLESDGFSFALDEEEPDYTYTIEVQKPAQATITYVKPEGATGEVPDAITVDAGTSHTLLANPFAMEGYTFAGWSISNYPTAGQLRAANTNYTVEENITITAVFRINYTVGYLDDNGDPINVNFIVRTDGYSSFAGDNYKLVEAVKVSNSISVYTIDPDFRMYLSANSETKATAWCTAMFFNSPIEANEEGIVLKFDGAGNAALGEVVGTYTMNEEWTNIILTFAGQQFTLPIELQEDYTCVLAGYATITIGETTYTFGEAPVTPAKTLADYAGEWSGELYLDDGYDTTYNRAVIQGNSVTIHESASTGSVTCELTNTSIENGNLVATGTTTYGGATITFTLTFTADNAMSLVYNSTADGVNNGTFTKAA